MSVNESVFSISPESIANRVRGMPIFQSRSEQVTDQLARVLIQNAFNSPRVHQFSLKIALPVQRDFNEKHYEDEILILSAQHVERLVEEMKERGFDIDIKKGHCAHRNGFARTRMIDISLPPGSPIRTGDGGSDFNAYNIKMIRKEKITEEQIIQNKVRKGAAYIAHKLDNSPYIATHFFDLPIGDSKSEKVNLSDKKAAKILARELQKIGFEVTLFEYNMYVTNPILKQTSEGPISSFVVLGHCLSTRFNWCCSWMLS